jgi:hypothetical protein
MKQLTADQALALLRQGKIAQRIWIGSRHIWMLDGHLATRAIRTLQRRNMLWEHYPHNGGSAGLKHELRNDGAAIAKAESKNE